MPIGTIVKESSFRKTHFSRMVLIAALLLPTVNVAAENATLQIAGHLEREAAISVPNSAPESFKDLAESSFYSFSTALGTREADLQEVDSTFYFWRTAKNEITVRVYVDGSLVGSTPGVPVVVGRGRLAFTESGVVDPAGPKPFQSLDILDQEPLRESPFVDLSIAWAGKQTDTITVDFGKLTLSDTKSRIDALQHN